MGQYKTLVLFDVGAVMLKLDYLDFYSKSASFTGETPKSFSKKFAESGIEKEVSTRRGYIPTFNAEFRKLLGEKGKGLTDPQLMEIYSLAWPGQIDEVVRLKKRVFESGNAVGNFSNMGEISYNFLKQKFPKMFKKYDASFPDFYSFERGFMKDDDRMFDNDELRNLTSPHK